MPSPPTTTDDLQAIATLCRREGIMPSNGTVTSQVFKLLARATAAEADNIRLRQDLEDARASCYAFHQELSQTQQALAYADAEADSEAEAEAEPE
jgi:hypothetical protein